MDREPLTAKDALHIMQNNGVRIISAPGYNWDMETPAEQRTGM